MLFNLQKGLENKWGLCDKSISTIKLEMKTITHNHVCYEYLFEKSRGIAGSSFLAFLKFSLIHILFPLWYKTEFPRQFYDISNLQTKNLLYLVLKNAIQMSLSATSGDSVMFKTIICLKIFGLLTYCF